MLHLKCCHVNVGTETIFRSFSLVFIETETKDIESMTEDFFKNLDEVFAEIVQGKFTEYHMYKEFVHETGKD